MNNVPQKLRRQLAADPYYATCARKGIHGHVCEGRVTWEHAVIFAGRQLQERWAILPLCAKAHSVDGFQDGGELDKEVNLWLALNRATDEELIAVSRATDYRARRARLNEMYGAYEEPRQPVPVPTWFWQGAYSPSLAKS